MNPSRPIPNRLAAALTPRRVVVILALAFLTLGSALADRSHPPLALSANTQLTPQPSADHLTDSGATLHDPARCGECLQLLLIKAANNSNPDDRAFFELIEVPDGRIIGVVKPAPAETLTRSGTKGAPRT